MNKLFTTAIITALLSACASTGQQENTGLSTADQQQAAEDNRGHPPRPMSQWRLESILNQHNANEDQELSWTEYDQWRRKSFDKRDADKNNLVDTQEYVYEFEARLDDRYEEERKGQVKQTITRFNALDKDDNQFIEWAEYETSGNRIFSRWDGNRDGTINDQDPKPSYRKGKKHQHKSTATAKTDYSKAGKKHQHKKRRRSAINMPTTHSKKGLLKLYDANDDKAVSRQEFVSERRSVFHLADENKDGKLAQSEYLGEYEDRLDTTIASSRRAAIKQTYIRFDVLDDNDDKAMTFTEFQISGKRIFNRWDKNKDGKISQSDVQQ